jgi:hypothetical protein
MISGQVVMTQPVFYRPSSEPSKAREAKMSSTLAALATENITRRVGWRVAVYQRTELSMGVLDPLELGALVLRGWDSACLS